MKKSIIYLLAFLPLCAAAQQSFEIKGKVGNWSDPAKVYLAYRIDNKLVLDSTSIQLGSFGFRGQVPSVMPAVLILDRTAKGYPNLTNATADYRQFYLGGENISVSSADSMKNSTITSRVNDSAMTAAVQAALQGAQQAKTWQPGEIAPLFAQPDPTGEIIQLTRFRGKIVLLDFWASWCMPCRAENPNLVKAYQKFRSKGFEIFSVSVDDTSRRTAWLDAIKKDNMQWVHASDLKGGDNNAAAKLYQIQSIPQNFLIDRDGKILAVNLRGEALEQKLEEVFTQGKPIAQEPEYVNYGSFVNVIAGFVQSGDTTLWKKTITSLQKSAQSAGEETPVHLPSAKILPGIKPLTDEDIYSKRKKSVLVIGKLRRAGGANINFEILGTAFVISKAWHCVTNYHVLQPDPGADDLLYFVITEDRKIYLVKELLSYSKNNDLAIFKIDGKGKQFDPIPVGKPAAVGAAVYCISHPAGELYYFSKGMVCRNVSKDSASLGTAYSVAGKTPIRMEISADYGGGSSGGPIMDKYGNLVGIVATTNTIYLNEMQPGGVKAHPQMVIRSTIPVKALTGLLK